MRLSITQVFTNGNGLLGLLPHSRLLMLRSSAIGLLRLGGAGANYLLQGWIARICGPHEFGIYALSWSIVMFAAAISNIGWQLLVIQTIPEYLEKRLSALAKGFLLSAHGASRRQQW